LDKDIFFVFLKIAVSLTFLNVVGILGVKVPLTVLWYA
jgi:hypothetical protein